MDASAHTHRVKTKTLLFLLLIVSTYFNFFKEVQPPLSHGPYWAIYNLNIMTNIPQKKDWRWPLKIDFKLLLLREENPHCQDLITSTRVLSLMPWWHHVIKWIYPLTTKVLSLSIWLISSHTNTLNDYMPDSYLLTGFCVWRHHHTIFITRISAPQQTSPNMYARKLSLTSVSVATATPAPNKLNTMRWINTITPKPFCVSPKVSPSLSWNSLKYILYLQTLNHPLSVAEGLARILKLYGVESSCWSFCCGKNVPQGSQDGLHSKGRPEFNP